MTTYRDLQTRQDAEAARQAMADRHAREAELQARYAEAFGIVALGVAFVSGLVACYRLGLFSWMGF